jgi:hypothetical protein
MVVCFHSQRSTPHAHGMLLEYLGTSQMPAAEYTFSEEQSPNALCVCFVPSIIADQALVMTLCEAESQQPDTIAKLRVSNEHDCRAES